MAKERKVSWIDSNESGVMVLVNKNDSTDKLSVDLTELFPGFLVMTENQRYIIEFGTKQSLSDDYAGIEDAVGKIAAATVGWNCLVTGEETPRKRKARTQADFDKSAENAKTKLAELEKSLVAYIASSDDDKIMAAKFGINRTGLEKAIAAAKKAVSTAEAKVKAEMAK
jgi:hypothetical protein